MKGPAIRNEESSPQQLHHTTKSQQGMRHDYSKEIQCKIKCKSVIFPTSYDEAKSSCKARKRKERQESVSSLCQERKVIRSNSEERPVQKKCTDNKNIRRVSSNEDFQKNQKNPVTFNEQFNLNNRQNSSANQEIVLSTFICEEYECEKRRSHERFAKPLAFKKPHKNNNKIPKARYLMKPKFKPTTTSDSHDKVAAQKIETSNETGLKDLVIEDEKLATFLQLHATDKDRSPSPVNKAFAPDIDLTTLHEQVDCSEPLLSCAAQQINEDTETLPGLSVASNRLLSSPRNSIIATHRIYLDPDVQQSNINLDSKVQNPLEQRLEKITKQINSLKKKIKKYEAEFESQNGYKLSHADKLTDINIRKLYVELGKMRKEHKQLTDIVGLDLNESGEDQVDNSNISMLNLQDTLNTIEKKLNEKRTLSKRSNVIENMSSDELMDEKTAVQKALLYLESIHGRPNNKEDRNLVRPIYDRYRNLKRMITKGNSTIIELATIHEDETMNFEIIPAAPAQLNEIDSEKSSIMASTDSDSTDTSISENLHSLTKDELIREHKLVSEEKKELRRTIKSFEADVQRKYGKMVQKDDKSQIEHVYVAYKKVKAKLKLLDALVGKQLKKN